MYNGHEYLSCIKIPAAKQIMTKNSHRSEKAEPMDLAVDRRDLISVANKVFGEGKWNHTVVSQTLDFVEIIEAKCCAGCVSFVKVQLENGNFHEDVGYYIAEESTKGLSIHNARIGSAVNALKRVLLSFGGKIERELQQLQKQINPEQANGVQTDVAQSLDKQASEKSNVLVNTTRPLESQHGTERLKVIGLSGSTKPFHVINHALQTEHISEPKPNKNSDLLVTGTTTTTTTSTTTTTATSILVPTVNNDTTEANPLSGKIQSAKNVEPLPNKTNYTNVQTSKPALSTNKSQVQSFLTELNQMEEQMEQMGKQIEQMEKQMKFKENMMDKECSDPESMNEMRRMKRKKKQIEKQMEFKKRMMEKEGIMYTNHKPNSRY